MRFSLPFFCAEKRHEWNQLPGWCSANSRGHKETQRLHPSRTILEKPPFLSPLSASRHAAPPVCSTPAQTFLFSQQQLAAQPAPTSTTQGGSVIFSPFPVETGCFLPAASAVVANTRGFSQGGRGGEKEMFIRPGNVAQEPKGPNKQ